MTLPPSPELERAHAADVARAAEPRTYAPPAPRRRRPWLLLLLLAVAPFAVAAAVYVVTSRAAPVYESSVTLIVGAPGTGGISDQTVSAANDLASQYAQLGNSPPVLRAAEDDLRLPAGSLDGQVSASTIAAQNLIGVRVRSGDQAAAVVRANAVAAAFAAYILDVNAKQADAYSAAVLERLRPLDRQIARARRNLDRDARDSPLRSDDALVYSNLVSQRQQVATSLAQQVVASQARLAPVAEALTAAKVAPKPRLYTLIAFAAIALLAARAAWWLLQRRRTV